MTIKEWKRTFYFKGKDFYYNRIKSNNPTERAVEIPIAFNFLADIKQTASVLEVGNVLSNYENQLSETLGIISRRIVDKFEVEAGVENEDLMNLRSEDKYDAIVSISTVEHIGQKGDPSGEYGEQTESRDLEAPLKAIAKIYDLLTYDGKALITVPFGKLIDGEWYIQFSNEYLYLLSKKYGIPKEAISINYLKLIDRESTENRFNMFWEELDALELSYVEYGSPFSQANAIAVIELSKLSTDFHLKLNVEPSPLLYNMQYDNRTEFEQNKALLKQTKSELEQTQAKLEEKQSKLQEIEFELEYSQTLLCDNQSQLENLKKLKFDGEQQLQVQLEQSHAQLHATQSELEQSHAQLHATQSELEQSHAQLHATHSELEQSHAQLHATQSELEQSQAQLHATQSELEQSQAQLHATHSELEQSQAQLHATHSELEQSQAQLHATHSELEQSHAQLHATHSELEQSQAQLHATHSELEQSQAQLHATHSELEQSQAQLHATHSELERLKFWQSMVRETDVNSQTKYKLLLWDGWYAYHKGDRAGMAQFLRESLKFTPFSTTETVLNWLENFVGFSSKKGEHLDTNSLVESAEWKELMRRSINGKSALTIH
jgi:peptidoglycan hydrolase CwlO-like protein